MVQRIAACEFRFQLLEIKKRFIMTYLTRNKYTMSVSERHNIVRHIVLPHLLSIYVEYWPSCLLNRGANLHFMQKIFIFPLKCIFLQV